MTVRRIRGRQLQAIRADYRRLQPLCEGCLALSPPRVRPWAVLDHKIALVNGGADFDVDPDQRQGLCHECHAIKTADDLGQVTKAGCDASGWPCDPLHPWNRRRST